MKIINLIRGLGWRFVLLMMFALVSQTAPAAESNFIFGIDGYSKEDSTPLFFDIPYVAGANYVVGNIIVTNKTTGDKHFSTNGAHYPTEKRNRVRNSENWFTDEGIYEIWFQVHGFGPVAPNVTVTVDRTPPKFERVSVGSPKVGEEFKIEVKLSDELSGMAGDSLEVSYSAGKNSNKFKCTADLSPNQSGSIQCGRATIDESWVDGNGDYPDELKVTVTATDRAGNSASTVSTVPIAPADVKISFTAKANQTNSITVSGLVSDFTDNANEIRITVGDVKNQHRETISLGAGKNKPFSHTFEGLAFSHQYSAYVEVFKNGKSVKPTFTGDREVSVTTPRAFRDLSVTLNEPAKVDGLVPGEEHSYDVALTAESDVNNFQLMFKLPDEFEPMGVPTYESDRSSRDKYAVYKNLDGNWDGAHKDALVNTRVRPDLKRGERVVIRVPVKVKDTVTVGDKPIQVEVMQDAWGEDSNRKAVEGSRYQTSLKLTIVAPSLTKPVVAVLDKDGGAVAGALPFNTAFTYRIELPAPAAVADVALMASLPDGIVLDKDGQIKLEGGYPNVLVDPGWTGSSAATTLLKGVALEKDKPLVVLIPVRVNTRATATLTFSADVAAAKGKPKSGSADVRIADTPIDVEWTSDDDLWAKQITVAGRINDADAREVTIEWSADDGATWHATKSFNAAQDGTFETTLKAPSDDGEYKLRFKAADDDKGRGETVVYSAVLGANIQAEDPVLTLRFPSTHTNSIQVLGSVEHGGTRVQTALIKWIADGNEFKSKPIAVINGEFDFSIKELAFNQAYPIIVELLDGKQKVVKTERTSIRTPAAYRNLTVTVKDPADPNKLVTGQTVELAVSLEATANAENFQLELRLPDELEVKASTPLKYEGSTTNAGGFAVRARMTNDWDGHKQTFLVNPRTSRPDLANKERIVIVATVQVKADAKPASLTVQARAWSEFGGAKTGVVPGSLGSATAALNVIDPSAADALDQLTLDVVPGSYVDADGSGGYTPGDTFSYRVGVTAKRDVKGLQLAYALPAQLEAQPGKKARLSVGDTTGNASILATHWTQGNLLSADVDLADKQRLVIDLPVRIRADADLDIEVVSRVTASATNVSGALESNEHRFALQNSLPAAVTLTVRAVAAAKDGSHPGDAAPALLEAQPNQRFFYDVTLTVGQWSLGNGQLDYALPAGLMLQPDTRPSAVGENADWLANGWTGSAGNTALLKPDTPFPASAQITLRLPLQVAGQAVPGASILNTWQASAARMAAPISLAHTLRVTARGAQQDKLVIGKTVSSDIVLPGESLQFTITIRNNSAEPLYDVAISDDAPTSTTLTDAHCPKRGNLPPPLTCRMEYPDAEAALLPGERVPSKARTVRWHFDGALPAGAQATVSYEVRVDGG